MNIDRTELEVRYTLFKVAVMDDQRGYYRSRLHKQTRSDIWVGRIRATFALLAGLASALAGFIVSDAVSSGTYEACEIRRLNPVVAEAVRAQQDVEVVDAGDCGVIEDIVPLLLIVAVVAPALGAAFTTLADLYQWDRLSAIYDTALQNLEVADAQSPLPAMEDDVYSASLAAYSEGTLNVMREETAQWGSLIKTPASLDAYVNNVLDRREELTNSPTAPPENTGQGADAGPAVPPPAPDTPDDDSP